jgi:hypothetical protein
MRHWAAHGRIEMQHTIEEIRELQYWATRAKGVPVKDAQALDTHLCFLLDIDDPEIIVDPEDFQDIA